MNSTMESERTSASHAPVESRLEQDLASLLEDLAQIQQELLDVLTKKQDLMAHGDIRGMNQLQSREQSLCTALQRCQQRRTSMLDRAKHRGMPAANLGNLASSLNTGKRGELKKQVSQASTRMQLLQHQSLANWVLAQKALLHLSQMLEIIATGGRVQPTYGKEANANGRGALMDQEV